MFKKSKLLKKALPSLYQKQTSHYNKSISNFNIKEQKSNRFLTNHIPYSQQESNEMLKYIGYQNIDSFQKDQLNPNLFSFKDQEPLYPEVNIEQAQQQFLETIDQNQIIKSYIGEGYYPSIMPSVIKRLVFQNPQWYTPYVPKHQEIAQGRCEAGFNYQILVSRLTGMEYSNASMLDEASAAAEAALMAKRLKKDKNIILISEDIFESSKQVIQSYCDQLNIETKILKIDEQSLDEYKNKFCGVVLQTPDRNGILHDYSDIIQTIKNNDAISIIGTDLLAQVITKPVGDMGADIVYGSAQRFGLPLGYGGPSAAFFSSLKKHIFESPARMYCRSRDIKGNNAFKLGWEFREQHIKKEKATSNICTASVQSSLINFFYALYHGEEGLIDIASRVHYYAKLFKLLLQQNSVQIINSEKPIFDTVTIKLNKEEQLEQKIRDANIDFYVTKDNNLRFSFDETKSIQDVIQLASIIVQKQLKEPQNFRLKEFEDNLQRKGSLFKESDVFNKIKGELQLSRYIKYLENKDMSMLNTMIPLGSSTMKLNAIYQHEYLLHQKLDLHPFQKLSQAQGYLTMLQDLSNRLMEITQMDAVTYQSLSGASGEYIGLKTIQEYYNSIKQNQRNIMLMPRSAHGSNFASTGKMGLKILDIELDDDGHISLKDLKKKIQGKEDQIFGIMITYPTTFGIFEEGTLDVVKEVKKCGAMVYIDGANINAQFMITSPGFIGDICHLNLHKSFAIPHGGGGPGMGPVLCKKNLSKFLPKHWNIDKTVFTKNGLQSSQGPQQFGNPFGNASLLTISYLYLKCAGSLGMKQCSQQANLSTAFLRELLKDHYKILYTNKKGLNAHEFLIDCEEIEQNTGITCEDIAKRVIDYGFHAPNLNQPKSFMIETTESENLQEIIKLAECLISIRKEIKKVEDGIWSKQDNPLVNAPHTQDEVMKENWNHCYSRQEASFPIDWVKYRKVWPSISRVDTNFEFNNLQFDYDDQLI